MPLGALLALVATGPQDLPQLGRTSAAAAAEFEALGWGKLSVLTRRERVVLLHYTYSACQRAAEERCRLVWAARHSIDSPLYAWPEAVCRRIVSRLQVAQHGAGEAAAARYARARALLNELLFLEQGIRFRCAYDSAEVSSISVKLAAAHRYG